MNRPVSPIAVDLLTRELAHQIKQDRKSIAERLHIVFAYLVESLELYREHWQDDAALTYQAAAELGWTAPRYRWLRSRPAVFDAGLWASVAELQRRGAMPGDDEQSSQPDEWVWWKVPVQDGQDTYGVKLLPGREGRRSPHDLSHGVTGNGESFGAALRQYRSEIFALPSLIAHGDKAGIDDFLGRVLPAIWPELAQEILAAQDRAFVDDLLDEHESMLTWLAYMEMVFDSTPPSMYGYIAGAGGGTLMLELRLLLPLLLLCTGRVVDRVIHEIAERLQACLPAQEDGQELDCAPEDFIKLLEQFATAAYEVHLIGGLRANGRDDELELPPVSRSDLPTLKAAIHKDKSCRRCGSREHTTLGPAASSTCHA